MRTLILALSVAGLATACSTDKAPDPKAKAPAPAVKQAETAKAETAKAETAKAETKAEPPAAKTPVEAQYTVRIIPGAATAGTAASSVVEVTPKPGFKMNKDFPVQIKQLKAPDGVALPKPTLAVADAELTEKLLRFTVPFTAAKAGKIDLAGLADFSVCNERACKLIRDEKVAWQVEVK